ncbi:hypothetical protein FH972_014190 [Carpinus fangiana]|uniref:Myb-like domain-containing protein n=1 Tax=Carpinus fangiana TaxID=176857 RepID=A0A5N6R8X3_9ROSI|nr:hypothetical protein FH972_014190 [Carpinus fangiana]
MIFSQDDDYMQRLVPETCDVAHNLNDETVDNMDIDWIKEDTCIRCNRGGDLLVCSEIGCPVALHYKCMCCNPKFDDLGHFYCPYCSYKRAILETRHLRKNAMLAKQALVNFIDKNVVAGNGKNQKDGESQSKEPDLSLHVGNTSRPDHEAWQRDDGGGQNESVQDEEGQQNERGDAGLASNRQHKIVVDDEACANTSTPGASDNVHFREGGITPGKELLQDSIIKDKSKEATISEARCEFAEDGEKIQAEDSQLIENSEHERILEEEDSQHEGIFEEEEGQEEVLNACHVNEEVLADGTLHASNEGSQDYLELSEENQGKTEDEEQMQPEAPIAPSNANVPLETSDTDTETLSARHKNRRFKRRARKKARPQNVNSPRKSSSQKSNSPEKNFRKPNEKAATSKNKKISASKKAKQPRESPKQFTKTTLPNARRKRLFWTLEEEDMLKEGVHRFSASAKKNLPWRRILDFGRHVFHATRTPIDLKDKWKNMMAKDSSTIMRR